MSENQTTQSAFEMPKLVISIDDMDAPTKRILKAAEMDTRVLGGPEDDTTRALFDALPGAIGRRIRKITPKGFAVTEIQLTLQLSGKLAGLELGGDIGVKLQPNKS